MYDLICIGCGPAGEKAATQAAYFGHRVAIVEALSAPGGAMVNTGTIPSKALRETALLCSAFRRRPLPGREIRIGDRLSMPAFMARRLLVEQQEHDRIESSMDRHGIEVHRGRGRLRDAHAVIVEQPDGTEEVLEAQFILIATGSAPLHPDNIPFEHPAVVDADGVLELDHMPKSMIIVGGGVIGCEYASVFAEIEVDVTLVNPRKDLLPFLDAECRDRLVASMCDAGVTLQLEASVKTVTPRADDRVEVTFEDGRTLEAETLLWAAGRRSNTDNLGLVPAGVTLGERGLILVNDTYRTNVPSIYAAGDVIGFPALAATSMEQGRIAACDMFDLQFKEKLAETMPLGIYTIPAISMVGLTEKQAADRGHAPVIGRAQFRDNARARMLGDEQGLLKCVFDRESRQLLGAAIVGEQATELIHLAQAVIAAHEGIDHFIDACFNYPSLSEMYKYAAYDALQAISRHRAA